MKYKKPLLVSKIQKHSSSTQKTISKFHLLNEQIEKISKDLSLSEQERQIQIQACKEAQNELGGLSGYQLASLKGSKLFNTGKWLVKKLQDLQVRKCSLLDVGALTTASYSKFPWIQATYIDLHPRVPSIKQANLLDYQPDSDRLYDVVCLALVLNFQGDPKVRFQMLKQAYQLIDQRSELGFLYVVLPLHCLSNSTKLSMKSFVGMMSVKLGMKLLDWKRSAKLIFFLFTCTSLGDCVMEIEDLAVDSSKGMNSFEIDCE